jgi:hypothetical protein
MAEDNRKKMFNCDSFFNFSENFLIVSEPRVNSTVRAMTMDDGTVDDVMLQDDDEDVIPLIVMSLDQFTCAPSEFVLAALFLSIISIHTGVFFPNPPNVTRADLSSPGQLPFPSFTRLSLFAALSAAAFRVPADPPGAPTAVDAVLRLNLTFSDGRPAKGLGEFALALPLPAASNISAFAHVLTLFEYNAGQASVDVASSAARRFQFQFTSPTTRHSLLSLLLSFLGVFALVIVYIFYRSEFRGEASDRLPPECTLMSYSTLFLVAGSDVWQYLLPFATPPAVWTFTRIVTALWTWFERLIVYALAKGRNVLERRTVTARELALFSLFAAVDVCRAVVNCRRYFEAPFAPGTASVVVSACASLVALAAWAVIVVSRWKRDWFVGLFFLCIALGSAVGPVLADVLGAFRETFFRSYEPLLPLVVCLFLYLVTWPVSGIEPATQRQGRRYGAALYQ